MSISITTNFSLNSNTPLDNRLVATGVDGLNNMEYKYEGLTVYRTDTGYNYVWDGDSWNLASNGIYGGSGSLISDTVIDEGFIGNTVGDRSNSLIMSGSSSTGVVNLSSGFIRNSTGDIEFKNSLSFGSATGPYISFNPNSDLVQKRGGFAIGTGDSINYTVSEKFRIDNNGLIRFKSSSSSTASLNIYHTPEGEHTFGYNWYNSKENTSMGSSFIKFTSEKMIFMHVATDSSTTQQSVSFNHPGSNYVVEFNGNVNVSRDIYLGDGQGFNHISYNGVGLGINSVSQEVSLLNNSFTKAISILDKTISIGAIDYTVNITNAATLSTSGSFNALYKTNIWDNAFNVDRVNSPSFSLVDNYWSRISDIAESINDNLSFDSVQVILNTDDFSQDAQFLFRPISYTNKQTISTWLNTKKSYDRIFYFYNDKSDFHITHELDWYLSNDDQTTWKKIGHLETGNQDAYNQGFGATASYAVRHYSQSVLVPAEMDFKIKFSFPREYTPDITPATASLPNFVITTIRSGKWRTENSDSTISNL